MKNIFKIICVITMFFVGVSFSFVGDQSANADTSMFSNTYTITYYLGVQGEGVYAQDVYEEGDTLVLPESPNREGYDFLGWYTKDDVLFEAMQVTEDIDVYAKWQIHTFNVYINFNNVAFENKTLPISYGSKVEKPTENLSGYTVTWFFDENCTLQYDFSKAVESDLYLYAKWELKALQNVKILYEASELLIKKDISIKIKFSHELNLPATLGDNIFVNLYRDSELVDLNLIINRAYDSQSKMYDYEIIAYDKLHEAKEYEYYAEIYLLYNGKDTHGETEKMNLFIQANESGIFAVEYTGNGLISWQDGDSDGASYIVDVYKDDVLIDSTAKSNCNGLSDNIKENSIKAIVDAQESGGAYRIVVTKYIGTTIVGSVSSGTLFNVYEVNFDGVLQELDNKFSMQLIEGGQKIDEVTILQTFSEYKFLGWFTKDDGEYKTEWNFGQDAVSEDLTLYAKWQIIDEVKIGQLQNIETVYEYQKSHKIEVLAEHDIYDLLEGKLKTDCNFEYSWFKQNGTSWEELEGKSGSALNVSFVADSGVYKCIVTFTDSYGHTKITESEAVTVNIQKAETVINHASVKKYYTYTGQEIKVESGATLTRQDEPVDIEYKNNTFVDVPAGGVKEITLYAPESANYKEKTTTFEIEVEKAQGAFNAELTPKIQDKFVYDNSVPKFEYELMAGNHSQKVVAVYEIDGSPANMVNAGEYYNVVLVAEENNNYKSCTYVLEKVVIQKRQISIKPNNVWGILFFDLSNLTYSLQGFVFNEIDVKITTDADKGKPGVYKIQVNASDPNYDIELLEGEYRVTVIPYYAVVLLLMVFVVIMIIKRKRKPFYLDFEENGGSIVPPIEAKKIKDIKASKPEREGYDFVGWYVDEELTKPYKNKLKRGKMHTVYAKWERKKGEAGYTKEQRIDKILKDLNIRKEPEKEVNNIVKEERGSEDAPLQKEQVLEKSQKDIMNEIISRAREVKVSESSEDLKEFIDSITGND